MAASCSRRRDTQQVAGSSAQYVVQQADDSLAALRREPFRSVCVVEMLTCLNGVTLFSIFATRLILLGRRQIYSLCFPTTNTPYVQVTTAPWCGVEAGKSGDFFFIDPSELDDLVSMFFSSRRERRLLPGQTKPSQSSNWGGGDLREAQVDIPLYLSHSCV